MLTTKAICVSLRMRGFTLGEIIKETDLPKTTIYYHIANIPLPAKVMARIRNERVRRLNDYIVKYRKGKCMPGRAPVPRPKKWSKGLLFLVAHFMFDGEIQNSGCIYHNRSKVLINQVENSMKQVFGLEPHHYFNKETGVYRISYYYVELASYIHSKALGLKKYIEKASLLKKKIFLRAFFDDEGCVGHWGKKRLVRGFQHNLGILKLIQNLLKNFDIPSSVDKKYQEIFICRKENLIKFRDEINFSKGIYVNPERKNSVWKQKLEKRKILDKVINSYQK